MLGLLASILFMAIIFGLVIWVISVLPLPPPFGQIVYVVAVVIFVLVLISYLLPLTGVGPYHGRW